MIPGFHRVSNREPCPVCKHGRWCLIGDDKVRVICPRTPSAQIFGDAGYLHRLDGSPLPTERIQFKRDDEIRLDCDSILRAYRLDTTTQRLERLSNLLGLSISALRRVGACWSDKYQAWAFPMRDAKGRAIGIRLRTEGGDKFAVRGSKQGLFIPDQLGTVGPILICEGPTDTAALLDFGFDAIGRPSCSGAVSLTVDFLRQQKRDAVIFADADGPGLCGAEQLAQSIYRPTKIIAPPRAKDARAWLNAGATRAAVSAVIASARYFRRKAG